MDTVQGLPSPGPPQQSLAPVSAQHTPSPIPTQDSPSLAPSPPHHTPSPAPAEYQAPPSPGLSYASEPEDTMDVALMDNQDNLGEAGSEVSVYLFGVMSYY